MAEAQSEEWMILSAALNECARVLEETGDDGRPLRELQGVARALLWTGDKQLRAVAFVLDAWIADYFYNFAGDMPSDASEQVAGIRGLFLKGTAATALRAISRGASAGVLELPGVVELLGGYLVAIEEANKV